MAKNLTVQQRINKIEEILRRETVVINKFSSSNSVYKRHRVFNGYITPSSGNYNHYYRISLENCRYKEGKLNLVFHDLISSKEIKDKIYSLISKYIDK